MRIISGKFRGVKLEAPKGFDVRPTTDRIKETVFNILCNKKSFIDTTVLDVFSGSGALGIEALSRGAANTVFLDASKVSLECTKINLKKIKRTDETYLGDFRLTLKKLQGRNFDFIFVDPPYEAGYYLEVINLVEKYNLIAKNGIMILEYPANLDLIIDPNKYIIDTRKFGTVAVSFLRASEGDE